MSATEPTLWVVGASGLLGSAVRRRAETNGTPVIAEPVPWSDPERAVRTLLEIAEGLPVEGWRLAWCAGGSVVASTDEQVDAELTLLRTFLERWRPGPAGSRSIFYASSGGGVYAGSAGPPFTEASVPSPLAPYGRGKLEAEALFSAFAAEHSIGLLNGRIANLYGPGQNLSKNQGLVSLLCKAHLTGKPLSIYVSGDTMRDYLYVDDAAQMVLVGLEAVVDRGGEHVKILASGSSVTILELIGELRRITRVKPPVLGGLSALSRLQVRDLRMRSTAWPPLQGCVGTPLGVGVAACLSAVADSLRCPQEGAR